MAPVRSASPRAGSAQAGRTPTDPAQAGRTPTDPAQAGRTPTDPAQVASVLRTPSDTAPRRPGPHRAVVSTGSVARFAERAELRRRLTRRRVLRGVVGVVAVLGLGWLGFVSPVFAVDPAEVVVTGADTVVDRAVIDEVVAEQAGGVPLPRLNTPELRNRLLEVPGVREARVSRVWPRGLAVLLVTRRPVVAVPDAGEFVLLDIDGIQVGRAATPPEGLPTASVPAENVRTLRAVLDVLDGLPPELTTETAQVGADSEDTVTLTLRDGATVVWGSAEDTALKIRVLEVLRSAEQTKGARVFDLSAPTLPITRS